MRRARHRDGRAGCLRRPHGPPAGRRPRHSTGVAEERALQVRRRRPAAVGVPDRGRRRDRGVARRPPPHFQSRALGPHAHHGRAHLVEHGARPARAQRRAWPVDLRGHRQCDPVRQSRRLPGPQHGLLPPRPPPRPPTRSPSGRSLTATHCPTTAGKEPSLRWRGLASCLRTRARTPRARCRSSPRS